MKIATTSVSKDGSAFESRFEAFKEALEWAKGKGVQLLCLPGGYFQAKSKAEMEKIERGIVQEAKCARIAVAVGIDSSQGRKSKKKNKNKAPRPYTEPSFAVTWSPQQRKQRWRQRSSTSKDQRFPSDEVCARPQTLAVAGKEIEVLACGELFNKRIRDSIIGRQRRPEALVDLSHDGKGFRADRSMRLLSQNGMYTFCSTHANLKGAMKRAFFPGGHKRRIRKPDSITTSEPRIEIKIWKI
jgi:hypothetical protein